MTVDRLTGVIARLRLSAVFLIARYTLFPADTAANATLVLTISLLVFNFIVIVKIVFLLVDLCDCASVTSK